MLWGSSGEHGSQAREGWLAGASPWPGWHHPGDLGVQRANVTLGNKGFSSSVSRLSCKLPTMKKKDILKVQLFIDVTICHETPQHESSLKGIKVKVVPSAKSPCHFHFLTWRIMFLRNTSGILVNTQWSSILITYWFYNFSRGGVFRSKNFRLTKYSKESSATTALGIRGQLLQKRLFAHL